MLSRAVLPLNPSSSTTDTVSDGERYLIQSLGNARKYLLDQLMRAPKPSAEPGEYEVWIEKVSQRLETYDNMCILGGIGHRDDEHIVRGLVDACRAIIPIARVEWINRFPLLLGEYAEEIRARCEQKECCLREKKGDVQRLQLQKDDDIPEPSRNEMTEQRNHGTLTHDVAERCLIETTKQRYVSLHLSEEEEEVYEMTVPLPKETETRTRTRTFETGRPSLRRRTETGRVPQEVRPGLPVPYVRVPTPSPEVWKIMNRKKTGAGKSVYLSGSTSSARHKGEGRRDEEAIRDWSVCTNCIARGEECVPNWGVWGKNPEDSACAPCHLRHTGCSNLSSKSRSWRRPTKRARLDSPGSVTSPGGSLPARPQRVPERLRAYREMNLEKWEVQLEDLLHVRARAKFEVKFWEERFAEADARLDEHLTRRPRPRTRLTSSPNKREVADDELSYVESSVSESEGITTTED